MRWGGGVCVWCVRQTREAGLRLGGTGRAAGERWPAAGKWGSCEQAGSKRGSQGGMQATRPCRESRWAREAARAINAAGPGNTHWAALTLRAFPTTSMPSTSSTGFGTDVARSSSTPSERQERGSHRLRQRGAAALQPGSSSPGAQSATARASVASWQAAEPGPPLHTAWTLAPAPAAPPVSSTAQYRLHSSKRQRRAPVVDGRRARPCGLKPCRRSRKEDVLWARCGGPQGAALRVEALQKTQEG